MKPIDHLDYLDTFMAELVVLSTYNIDPVFFEKRVLRTKALDRARRIAVLVDADEWATASRSDLPMRWANCRYLVVPLTHRPGVFHPKVGLFLTETEAVVACGSGNLTRPGMTHNLEILNLIQARCNDGTWSGSAAVVAQAVQFFETVIAAARNKEAVILQDWLKECWSYGLPAADATSDDMTLLHTCNGDLWQPVSEAIDDAEPEEITILSPFFDRDLSLLRRVRERWTSAQVSIIAQSQSSSLDAALANRIAPDAQICSLTKDSRRLHAKLLAWEGRRSSGYLVGSANFTTAAFDGRNVEACLLVHESARLDATLFRTGFEPTPISPADFVNGLTSEPARDQEDHADPLAINEAVIGEDGMLSISYTIANPQRWETVSFGLRGVRDADPSFSRQVPSKPVGSTKADLSESPFTSRGAAIRCTLIGVSEAERVESRAAWVVQEDRLTHERGASRSSRIRKRIEESGTGLVEQMTEIGSREGFCGVIDFLDQVNIRYHDGGGRAPGGRALSIRISDPWDPGKVPRWLDDESVSAEDLKRLGKSICDYADRHEKT